MIGIDYDANAIAHREVSRKISELEQELIELKKAYIGISGQIKSFQYQLECDPHEWVLGNVGIINRVCVKCGVII